MPEVRVEFHPEAAAEVEASYRWYAERDQKAAYIYLEEIDHAIQMVIDEPARWPGFLRGTRRYVLRRFPFSLVYRERADMIQVVAVAHAKRRPGYWKDRAAQ